MSGAITATVGVGILGAVTAKNSSDKATDAASASSAAELEFAKEQYDDWKQTFGGVEDNLAEYYENLTPGYIASQGLQAIETERAAATKRITQTLAQRGLTNSGLETAALSDLELQTATQKASVRATAEQQAAGEQLKFLSLGYGQNPQARVQNVLSGQANDDVNYATQQQVSSGQATQAAVETAGTALVDYIRS